MKKFLLVKLFLLVGLLFLLPGIVSAQASGIWEGTGGGEGCNIKGPCNFCDGLIVIQNIIKFLFEIAIPISVAMIIYGAILLMIAGGSEDKIKNGKNAITSAVIGLVITLSAWIIVNTILHILTGSINFPWNQLSC